MNLSRKLEQYLPQVALEVIWNIGNRASQSGQQLYLVGGIVRDLLLECPNFDLDFVVEGNAVTLAQQIAASSSARTMTYPRFGTAKLKFDAFAIDIATARNETYARPGALPIVTPGTLKDDLSRRDFAINAMAISLVPESYGELVDPYHGLNDLQHRLIRILHPQSFRDDATRILRAIRYEQRLNFNLERETSQLLKENIPLLDTISNDRIRRELNLILLEECPERALGRLCELRVLPELALSPKERGWLAEKFQKARSQHRTGSLAQLYLCLLVYPFTPESLEKFLCRLNMPGRASQMLRKTLNLKASLFLLGGETMKNSEIHHLLKDYAPVVLQANAIASDVEVIHRRLVLFSNELRQIAIYSTGNDLTRLGFPPGPETGEVLKQLLKAKLDGSIKTRAEEEKLAIELKTTEAGTARTQPRRNRR
ncbi:MAG: CCA tRNA nucleotidyltransferase [Dehalococcoidia bacterium]|nr:CCA tRNA nucleotidyltransferase [Dehalococcoidia bacterium]